MNNKDFFGEYIDNNKYLFTNIKSWIWVLSQSNDNEIRDIITAMNNERVKRTNSLQVVSCMFALKALNIKY